MPTVASTLSDALELEAVSDDGAALFWQPVNIAAKTIERQIQICDVRMRCLPSGERQAGNWHERNRATDRQPLSKQIQLPAASAEPLNDFA